jgi:metal-responsive CopG/Arc/MetJ family transcriptional regulator
MAKIKLTISIEEKFVAALDKIAKLKHTNRSNLIEKAIRVWEKGYIEEALRIGYQRMVKEDSKIAEEYVKIAQEILHE